jgi:hypothetical protein
MTLRRTTAAATAAVFALTLAGCGDDGADTGSELDNETDFGDMDGTEEGDEPTS